MRVAVERLPHAEVAWFDGADHDIHAQRPVELAARMLAFLAGLPGEATLRRDRSVWSHAPAPVTDQGVHEEHSIRSDTHEGVG